MPGQSAARRSHWRRDSPPRSAGRGSGSSRRARAVPVPDHADLRGRRPGVRQSPAVARWPIAAKSRHPKSTDRRRKQCARVCPSPIANQVESPCFLPWWGRTPSASVDPDSATKSYTKPKVYLLPASPLMRPGELFGLVGRSLDRTNDRLLRLFHAGYIDRPRAQLDYYPTFGSAPMIYALADRGAHLLREWDGAEFRNPEWSRKNREAGRPFIEHQIEIVEFEVGVQRAVRARSGVKLITAEDMIAAAPGQLTA